MDKKNKLFNFMKSPLHIIISLVVSGGFICVVYYLRKILDSSYKITNSIALALVLLCAANVFIVIKDKESRPLDLFKENIPGIIFFISFIVCKLILRG